MKSPEFEKLTEREKELINAAIPRLILQKHNKRNKTLPPGVRDSYV